MSRFDSVASAARPTSHLPDEHVSLAAALMALLDRFDFAIFLCRQDGQVAASNLAARAPHWPPALWADVDGCLTAADRVTTIRLQQCIGDAASRGCHRLLELPGPATRTALVMPLMSDGQLVGVLLSREVACNEWIIALLSQSRRLTGAERQVLHSLLQGTPAELIARTRNRRLSTVRTQVGAIRAKLDAPSIDSLLLFCAGLPPVRPLGPVAQVASRTTPAALGPGPGKVPEPRRRPNGGARAPEAVHMARDLGRIQVVPPTHMATAPVCPHGVLRTVLGDD
jgi:DNA-binding CsgD family transcriptional regulator